MHKTKYEGNAKEPWYTNAALLLSTEHMSTSKAKISLYIHGVCQGNSSSLRGVLETVEIKAHTDAYSGLVLFVWVEFNSSTPEFQK